MIVAGVGCRRGAPAPDIEAAIRAALANAGINSNALGAIATATAKQNEAGIETAAANFGVNVVVGIGRRTQGRRRAHRNKIGARARADGRAFGR